MDSAAAGSLGFWIFMAAIVAGAMWEESRQKAEKHETLRRIVEKTGTVDEARLQELFGSAPSSPYVPGSGYRALRITGSIIMFVSAVPGILGVTAALVGGHLSLPPAPAEFIYGTLSISAGLAVLGFGVFFSARFAEPPPDARKDLTGR